jgi:hypothetical protein
MESDLAPEMQQVRREYFARSPGSDIWVHFDDLSDDVSRALWAKHHSKLAFPAGLFDDPDDLPFDDGLSKLVLAQSPVQRAVVPQSAKARVMLCSANQAGRKSTCPSSGPLSSASWQE